MAIRFYDNAIVDKIKSWVKDDRVTITAPDETKRLFEYIADIKNDKPIELPLIAISRTNTIDILNISKRPMTFDGYTINNPSNGANISHKNDKKSVQVNAVPIRLSYQIDIYTRYMAEADEYVRNFVFNIINYPKLKVEIPYENIDTFHISNIRLNTEIADNSAIPERLIAGQFTRFTLQIYIDDAYLFSVPIRNNLSIDASIEAHLDNTGE